MSKMNYSRPCFRMKPVEKFYSIPKGSKRPNAKQMRGKEHALWKRKLDYLENSRYAFSWERRIAKSINEQFKKFSCITPKQKKLIEKMGKEAASKHRAAIAAQVAA